MKKLFVSAVLGLSLVAFGATRSLAFDHDDRGWYDNDHHRHAFIEHGHHHGYWDNRNGARVFINID